MTGLEVYNYILRIFKRTDKSTETYEALNDVIWDMRNRYKWEDNKEYTSLLGISAIGDYKLTLPSDFGHLIGDVVFIDSGSDRGGSQPMNKLSKEEYDVKYPNPSATSPVTGQPEDYCLYGNTIYLGNVPDAIDYGYKINYTTDDTATEIDASTASVPFTPKYREVIRNMVLSRLYDGLENDNLARKHEALGEIGLEKMVNNEEVNIRSAQTTEYVAY